MKNVVASVLARLRNHSKSSGAPFQQVLQQLKAIDATFLNRETPVPTDEFDALTKNFVEGHRVQWNAFVKKIGEDELTDSFGTIVEDLRIFTMPVLWSLARGEQLTQRWKAGSGWIAS